MLQIYANSVNSEQIEGLILPLFDKFKQQYNMYTYEILMEMYFRMKDFHKAMRIWNQSKVKIAENK